MLNKIKPLIQPPMDVLPLNVSPARYLEIFESPPPQRLGIAFLLLVPDRGDPMIVRMLSREMDRISQTFDAFLDFDEFAQEFVPACASDLKIAHLIVGQPEGVLGLGSTKSSDDSMTMVPSVVFFNADMPFETLHIQGYAMAIRVIEQLAIATGSYEPASHRPFSMPAQDADEYDRVVGELFDKGPGIWCRGLLPYYNAWRNGMLAYLERKSVVEAMRGSLISSYQPRELRFVSFDRGPWLEVVRR